MWMQPHLSRIYVPGPCATHQANQQWVSQRSFPQGAYFQPGRRDKSRNVFFVWLGFCFVLFFFQDRVSLCSPGCPRAHSVDQAVLKLRNLPASASQVLGLKACATTALWNVCSYCCWTWGRAGSGKDGERHCGKCEFTTSFLGRKHWSTEIKQGFLA